MLANESLDRAESEIESGVSEVRYGRYFLGLFAIVIVPFFLPLLVLRLPGFEHWSGSKFGAILEYPFVAAGTNADIVIFGDSSALFGVDPRRVSAELGLKAIVIPETIGSLGATGDMALRHYLKVNAAPKLLVIYLTGWDLNYAQADTTFWYEGEEMLVRHASAAEMARFAVEHPEETFLFPFRFYAANHFWTALISHREGRFPEIVKGQGHLDNQPDGREEQSPCAFPADLLQRPRTDTARELYTRYKTEQTRVLFYIAPIPACGNAGAFQHFPFGELPAAPPRTMPVSSFQGDHMFVHLYANAVPEATDYLVAALRPALQQ